LKEVDLVSQIKKYVDLVNHLELEKNQANTEKEQYQVEKCDADKRYEKLLKEMDENMFKEKEKIVENIETQIRISTEQVCLRFLNK
jgi:hypothetical protein